jgi:hypothetical protein
MKMLTPQAGVVTATLAVLGLAGVALSPAAAAAPAMLEPCGGGYFHCETNICESAQFYSDYNPTTDHFSDPRGKPLVRGEQGNIRNEPYRRYGPRGVRGMHAGAHGFYSKNCFPG